MQQEPPTSSLVCCGPDWHSARHETAAGRPAQHHWSAQQHNSAPTLFIPRHCDACFSFMPPSQAQSQRKRKRESCTGNEARSNFKRRKNSSSSSYPPRFWDTLTQVQLTRRALSEFDRRTAPAKPSRLHQIATGSISRRTLRSDSRRLRDFACNGGPDLSVLRGVR